MTITVPILISIIALITTIISVSFAIYFGLKGSKRNDSADIEKKAYEQANINVKLDQIGGDVRDIKYDMTGVKKDFQLLSERVALTERDMEVANRRIKDLEER
jgi:peptidoglycan hydrolase CwlO-like protein